ncbi:MAG: restriction endonuclease subunit S, partial [Patescibacteria group bacterium]|nr:restriction endonuclease subunit S [Patescibacteria group bacterium]
MKWQTKKLEDICNVEYGARVVRRRDGGSKYPVYGGGGETFAMDEYNREDRMIVARFAMSEQCTRFVKGKFFLNDSGLTLSPKDKQIILQDFLDFQILALNDRIYSLARGAAQKNLDVPSFRKMEISYPESTEEQKRIVKLLDEIFEKTAKAQENTEKNLQNSKELFESYLNKIFENPSEDSQTKMLSEFFEITSSKRVFKSEWKSSGVPFYRAREIVKLAQQGFVNNSLFVSEEMYSRYATKYGIPKEGDLMVTGVGTLGICYLVKKKDKFYFKDGNIIWLKTKNNINSQFVEYAFKSKLLRKQISNTIGATVGTYTIIRAKNTSLLVPPLLKQQEIVKKLGTLSAETKKLEKIYEQKLTDLEEFKKSVLKKAFSGK